METVWFACALICGLVPSYVWSRLGGDEDFLSHHPKYYKSIHFLHHFYIGLIILVVGALLDYYCWSLQWLSYLVAAFGCSMAMDDLMFHAFERFLQNS